MCFCRAELKKLQGKATCTMSGHFFTGTEHWDRLPIEAVGSPSPEILKTHQDAILHNVL